MALVRLVGAIVIGMPAPVPAASTGPGRAASPVPASSAPSAPTGHILGRWSRSPGECGQPELTFTPTRAVIRAPVGARRTELAYDGVAYVRYHRQVEVQFRRPHPYSTAPEPQALLFELTGDGTAGLQLKTGKVPFMRCP